MSSNKMIYDSCAYGLRLNDNRDVFHYYVYTPKYENCTKCITGSEKDRQRMAIRVDLESDLRDQTRLNSLCPSKKYLPCGYGNADACKVYPTITPYLCEREIVQWDNHIPKNRIYPTAYKTDTRTCARK